MFLCLSVASKGNKHKLFIITSLLCGVITKTTNNMQRNGDFSLQSQRLILNYLLDLYKST